MKGLLFTIAVLVAATSLAVGVSGSLAAPQSVGAAVKVANVGSGLGQILVDGRGHTLYLFEKDKRGKGACAGKCAAFWPPLIASGKPLALAGAKASLIGTAKRGDGRLQVTYNHHPLYLFVKDTGKGQANGEEVDAFGGEWYAVSAKGAKVEKSDAKAAGIDPAEAGYGQNAPPADYGQAAAPGGYGY